MPWWQSKQVAIKFDYMNIEIIAGLVPLVFWGVNALFEKKSVTLAGVLGLIPAVIAGDLPNFDLKFFIFVSIFAFFDFLGMYLFYKGFLVSKVGIITPISSSYAIVIAIISFVFFDEPLSLTKFALIVLIVLGIVLLSINLKEWKTAKKSDYVGVLYALAIFTIYGVWVPLWDQFIAQGGYLYILTVDRVIVLLLVLGVVAYKKTDLKIGKPAFGWVFLSAVFLVVANTVYNWGLYNSDETSLVAAISSAYPLVAVICAYFFLKEKLAANQYVGIVVIVIGIVLISLL